MPFLAFFHRCSRIALILLLTFIGGVSYGSPIERLVCVSTVFEPYVIEQDGKVTGIDVDVVREIGRRLNIEIDVQLKPWIRLEKDIESGEESCAFAYFQTPRREQYMDFTNVPLHITSYALFTKENPTLDYRGLSDIKGYRVGINQGFKTPAAFDEAVERNELIEFRVAEEAQSFQMLEVDRLDAVLTNSFVGAYQVKKLGLKNIEPLFPPLSSTPAYLTFSKEADLSHLVQNFNSALYEILLDGTYQDIFDRYVK